MNGYVALYNGKRAEIWADSLWEAKQKAILYFAPPKSKVWTVDVILAQVGEKDVVHSTAAIG
jgi:hypothetical protein